MLVDQSHTMLMNVPTQIGYYRHRRAPKPGQHPERPGQGKGARDRCDGFQLAKSELAVAIDEAQKRPEDRPRTVASLVVDVAGPDPLRSARPLARARAGRTFEPPRGEAPCGS